MKGDIQKMKGKIIQSLTAYTCRICKKYKSDNLLVQNDSDDFVNLEDLLKEFFAYISECKIDLYTSKALFLENEPKCVNLETQMTRIHIQPSAGKALENFSVVNYSTNEHQKYNGDKYSAMYIHNILFYIKGNQNVFVFHHYGQSGCKTAFLNTFNRFLSEKGLIAHLDVLISKSMFDDAKKYVPEKLNLITTYEEMSSDKAENIREKKNKKVEQEVIISLNAPRALGLLNWFVVGIRKSPTIEELKQVLIQENYPADFERAKLTLKFGNVQRKIDLTEFTGMLAEYDVTDKLELHVDGSVCEESLYTVVGEYANQFFDN